jgi:hypothetical protein
MMLLSARTSCRCLGPGKHPSVTSEPSSLTVVAGYLFLYFSWVAEHAAAPEPSRIAPPLALGGGVRCHGTCGGSGALRAGKRGPVPRGAWRPRSPPAQGGEVQSHGTRGGPRALPRREAGSGAAGRVAVPEPSRTGRRDPELQDAWQHKSPPA